MTKKKCEANVGTFRDVVMCQETATVYGGGRGAGDWAGYYCEKCLTIRGFDIFDRHPNGVLEEVK
jgi:hypothetical protein